MECLHGMLCWVFVASLLNNVQTLWRQVMLRGLGVCVCVGGWECVCVCVCVCVHVSQCLAEAV